ncbi:MAG: hypothetical protein WBE76_06635 [Terracidiphilus sp.]
MEHELSLELTFTLGTAESGVAARYQFRTGISLDPNIPNILGLISSGSVTVPPGPPKWPHLQYEFLIVPGEDSSLIAKFIVNGQEGLSVPFRPGQSFEGSNSIPVSGGTAYLAASRAS